MRGRDLEVEAAHEMAIEQNEKAKDIIRRKLNEIDEAAKQVEHLEDEYEIMLDMDVDELVRQYGGGILWTCVSDGGMYFSK